MSILPLIAASLLAPSTTTGANVAPAWLAPAPLLVTESLIEPSLAPEQHSENRAGSSRGWYVRASGGFVTTSNSDGPGEEIDFDEGYMLSLGVGHRFGANETGIGFAVELDGIWTDQDTSDSGGLQAVRDINVAGALIDGIVDFRLADQFTIYAGAGVGVAWLDVGSSDDDLDSFDDEDGPFLAWQLKGGIGWHFTDRIALVVGYRFLNVDDAEFDDADSDTSFDLETQQHILEAGLIFGF